MANSQPPARNRDLANPDYPSLHSVTFVTLVASREANISAHMKTAV
jgi:hypothetical protein